MDHKSLSAKLAGLSCAFLTACAAPPKNALDNLLSLTPAQNKEYTSWLKDPSDLVSGYSCETGEGRAVVNTEEDQITLSIEKFGGPSLKAFVPLTGNHDQDRMNFHRLEQRADDFCGPMQPIV